MQHLRCRYQGNIRHHHADCDLGRQRGTAYDQWEEAFSRRAMSHAGSRLRPADHNRGITMEVIERADGREGRRARSRSSAASTEPRTACEGDLDQRTGSHAIDKPNGLSSQGCLGAKLQVA